MAIDVSSVRSAVLDQLLSVGLVGMAVLAVAALLWAFHHLRGLLHTSVPFAAVATGPVVVVTPYADRESAMFAYDMFVPEERAFVDALTARGDSFESAVHKVDLRSESLSRRALRDAGL